MIRLARNEWTARAARHAARLRPIVEAHLDRKSRSIAHPVIDFLFTYYAFPPAQLMAWSPGIDVVLEDAAGEPALARPGFVEEGKDVRLDPSKFPAHRLGGLRWTIQLLEHTAAHEARFGCFGLHEWAMVYRSGSVRHGGVPLRMAPEELASFVDSQRLCCSHFDAYRFFTPAALPLNRTRLEKDTRHEDEQPGCLHANMDLYRWSYKFSPWIGSDFIGDAFLLAMDIRELDMRASPYDLGAMGYAPVRIETPEGRAEYVALQQQLAARSAPMRAALVQSMKTLLGRCESEVLT